MTDPNSLEWVRLVVENHVPVLLPHADQTGIAKSLRSILSCASSSAGDYGVAAFRPTGILVDDG
eukprot:2072327-Heterocapsa_arctica.AAC.1